MWNCAGRECTMWIYICPKKKKRKSVKYRFTILSIFFANLFLSSRVSFVNRFAENRRRNSRDRLDSAIPVFSTGSLRSPQTPPRIRYYINRGGEDKEKREIEDPCVLPAGKLRRMRPLPFVLRRSRDIVSRLRGGSPWQQPIKGCISRVMPQDTSPSPNIESRQCPPAWRARIWMLLSLRRHVPSSSSGENIRETLTL